MFISDNFLRKVMSPSWHYKIIQSLRASVKRFLFIGNFALLPRNLIVLSCLLWRTKKTWLFRVATARQVTFKLSIEVMIPVFNVGCSAD